MREIQLHDFLSFRQCYVISDWDEKNNSYLLLWAKAQTADGVREIMQNEELQLLNQLPSMKSGFSSIGNIMARHKLLKTYSFAIPDEAALRLILRHSPSGILEIGAGTGYWAMLLNSIGADVVAYEPETGCYRDGLEFGRHFAATRADHKAALKKEGHDRTLFLCWPDLSDQFTDQRHWPEQCLRLYRGPAVAYVGETSGGCTASDRFHAMLEKEWREVEDAPLPNWFGLHDCLTIYRRKRR